MKILSLRLKELAHSWTLRLPEVNAFGIERFKAKRAISVCPATVNPNHILRDVGHCAPKSATPEPSWHALLLLTKPNIRRSEVR
jgi:hypothetical protein